MASGTTMSDGASSNSKAISFPFVQRHGQRTYGPPAWWVGPPPPKGSEIFVGKLPKNLTDDELQGLMPVFERIGPVYEMRLLMQFSQQNRGFAFVKYTCPEHAERAVDRLNGFQVRPGKRIGVIKSVEHCKIEIEDMPVDNKEEGEILEELRKWTKGVVKVEVDRAAGVVVVEYESHFDAGVARRELLFQAKPFGKSLMDVYWAAQPKELPTLFINNIPLTATESQLTQLFSNYGLSFVDKMRNKSYAFVRFLSKEDAETALKRLDGSLVNGYTLEAKWAKRSNLGKSVKYIRGRKNDFRESSPFGEKTLGNPWLDDPVTLLKNLCVESGYPEPYYTVTYNDCSSLGSHRTYTALVFLPTNIYPLNPHPFPNEGFRTPEIAKAFAAISVLKRLGYDHNFGFNFHHQPVLTPPSPIFLGTPSDAASILPTPLSVLPPNIPHDSRSLNIMNERIRNYPDFCSPSLKEETPSMDLLAEAVALANMGLQSSSPLSKHFLK